VFEGAVKHAFHRWLYESLHNSYAKGRCQGKRIFRWQVKDAHGGEKKCGKCFHLSESLGDFMAYMAFMGLYSLYSFQNQTLFAFAFA